MAIQCRKCEYVFPGVNSLHLVTKCVKCGNTERDMFFRVEDTDINSKKNKEEGKWLQKRTIK